MKQTKRIFAIVLATGMLFTGCGNQTSKQLNQYEQDLLGKWAYAHDLETEAASFQNNGKAKFEGKNYEFSSDGSLLDLKGQSKEELHLRYIQNENKMYLYVQSLYTLQTEALEDEVVGLWYCEPKGWTFEFTDQGTFMEDGVLTGYYEADPETGTIKLMYGEALEDTVFYYHLTSEGMFVEYPWLMQKME